MSEALEQLEYLLENGWEWPDASAKVAVEFRVDIDALTNEYDARFH